MPDLYMLRGGSRKPHWLVRKLAKLPDGCKHDLAAGRCRKCGLRLR